MTIVGYFDRIAIIEKRKIMAKTIGNDKAIEFQSELLKTRKMIRNLKTIGVNSSMYIQRIDEIEEMCHSCFLKQHGSGASDSVQIMQRANAELVYIKAIGELQKLQNELKNYDIYFSSFNYVDSIDFTKSFNQQELDVIARNIIGFLDAINSSDTRYYASERNVVEKLYHFAYQIIKLELKTSGKSKVLDWVKANPIAANFIDAEVEQDIKSLDKDDLDNPILKNALSATKSNGLNFSYLNEGIILATAIQGNDELLENIRRELISLADALEDNLEQMEKNDELANKYSNNVFEYKKKLRRNRMLNIIKIIGSLSIVTGILLGGFKIGKNICKTSYPTRNEIYSESDNVQTPKIDGYFTPIVQNIPDDVDEVTTTNVIVYESWTDTGRGYFARSVTTYDASMVYDVNSTHYNSLGDYASLDLDAFGIDGDETMEYKDTLTAEDMYNGTIVEVERIIQDIDEEKAEYSGLAGSVILGEMLVISSFILVDLIIRQKYSFEKMVTSIPQNISKNKKNRKALKNYLEKLEKLLKENKQLILENEEFRNRFVELYQKYAPFIQNRKIEEKYQKLVREK